MSDLSRSSDDPFIEAPGVTSFSDEYLVQVSWTEDDCADEYLLYRSIEGTDEYSLIYQGNTPSYSDSEVIDQKRYLYRLVKMRGDESFGPSNTNMGVGSMTTEDEYEPNDSEATATEFEYDISANSYFYVSQDAEHTLEDLDWYSVEVRSGFKAVFEISATALTAEGKTGLYYYINPGTSEEVTNGGEIQIVNETLAKKTFYFCIYPYVESIITDSSAGGGGMLIPYSLSYIGEYINVSD